MPRGTREAVVEDQAEEMEVDESNVIDARPEAALDLDTVGTECYCGCGEFTPAKSKSKFRPGHDAKLKSAILAKRRQLLIADYGTAISGIVTADAYLGGFGRQAGDEDKVANKWSQLKPEDKRKVNDRAKSLFSQRSKDDGMDGVELDADGDEVSDGFSSTRGYDYAKDAWPKLWDVDHAFYLKASEIDGVAEGSFRAAVDGYNASNAAE